MADCLILLPQLHTMFASPSYPHVRSESDSSSEESPEAPVMSPGEGKGEQESPPQTAEENGKEGESQTVEGLFGDTAEISSS